MIDPDSGVMTPVKPSCIGPLAIHIDAFAARLGGEGYTSKTVHDKCELVAKLSVGSIGATFRRMRSTRVSSTIFTQIVVAKAMCGVAKWQPANNCSDTYVISVAFGPCRRELIQPLWVTSRETSDVT